MSNSNLVKRKFPFPTNLLNHMQKVSGGNYSTKIKNFLNQGYLTYFDLKNLVRDYPQSSDEEKKGYGGDVFFKWVSGVLNGSRARVKQHKENLSLAGAHNTFIKPHEKNKPLSANTEKHIYENIKKIYVSESTFKQIKHGKNLFKT